MLIFFKKYLRSKIENFNEELKTILNISLKRQKKDTLKLLKDF